LSHDQLDILILKTSSIDFFSVILVIVLLVITSIDSLALAVVVTRVIVAGVVMSRVIVGLSSSQLLSSGSLGLRVEILNLGLTEDTSRRLAGSHPTPVNPRLLTCMCC
jgi:hypothetical protein